jgi:hypothetical protein
MKNLKAALEHFNVHYKAIKDMTTAEILAEVNQLNNSDVKRFATRADGEKRLEKARNEWNEIHVGRYEQHLQRTAGKQVTAPKFEGVVPEGFDEHERRSAGVKESWKDPSVHAKRVKRDNVSVVGVGIYRSVREAFLKLKLPLNKHIKFRMELKEAGEKDFVDGDRVLTFVLTQAALV